MECCRRSRWPRILRAALVVAILAFGRPGLATATEAPDLAAPLALDPAVRRGTLENGLTYFIRANPKPEKRAELRLLVNAGSVLEDDDQRGLAHFVEHMGFNGTRHFAKQELIDYLERIGMSFGADVNAYTNFDETVYMLTVPTDDAAYLKKAFLILGDWAQGVSFDDGDVSAERGVVLEELRSGLGADQRMWDQHYTVLFRGSRYAERLTIGKKEVLEHAPPEALRRFYRDWYRPDLMAVVAVGDFDVERIEKLVRKRFGRLRAPREIRRHESYPVPDQDGTLFSIAADPEATSTSVSVCYKLPRRQTDSVGDYRRELGERLYHAMLGARLDERRQEPDPPFLSASSFTGNLVRSRDVYVQTVNVEDTGLERGLEALLSEIERVERHGFTHTELERAKRKALRSLEQAWRERDKRDSAIFARQLGAHYLDGEPMLSADDALALGRALFPEIELEEVNHLAREWVTGQDGVVLVSAPDKSDLTHPDESALLALFDRVRRMEIGAYVDRVRDEPLVAERPASGEIVERRQIPEIGVTEWRLSNGVRVVLKPTDFKNDEVLVSGFSPGGTSLAPDERYISAASAGTVVQAGGVGRFDRVELTKALAGKVVRVNPWIGELEESVGGSASPDDLETLFQLVYLYFTAPRKDQDAFDAWRARAKASLKDRLADPETVFSDAFNDKLYGGHFRRKPPSLERVNQVDLEQALAFYRERFADAGDFTFAVVGSFDLESIEPLVRSYLGSLPAPGRKETWKDVGVRTPPGVVRVEVRKGIDDKSQVDLEFTGDATWSREEAHAIGALAQLLDIRLREVLREEMGATYGVGVSGYIKRRPREEYDFDVWFGCSPANVQKMIDAVFDTMDSIARNGIDKSYVEKVREIETRERETALKENGFWSGQLLEHYRYGTDPLLILDYDALVRSVTPERMQATAQRYLNKERYVLGVLYPETEGTTRTP